MIGWRLAAARAIRGKGIRPTIIRTIIVVGALLCAAPLATEAEQAGRLYRVGVLDVLGAASNEANLRAFRQGLRELGYEEGQNLVIEYRSADGRAERFPDLATELVRLKVDVIVSSSGAATRAAKKATSTIPIVMVMNASPVQDGLVASLPRPGGNVTGLAEWSEDLIPKRLALLKEAAPGAVRVAWL